MNPLFSPSLMCMDLLEIKQQTEILNQRCDLYHVDIMDGHYVKNITLSPDFVSVFHTIAKRPIDCHLMVTDPDDYIEALAEAGATYICPHAELITATAFRTLDKIQQLGCKAGVVLCPATPLDSLCHYIHRLDKLTIMSVDPGFAGQAFIPEMLDKIRQAKELKEKYGYHYLIEVDGSCNETTFGALRDAGAEVFIVGSSGLFSKDADLTVAWDKMMQLYHKAVGDA